ncbi:MAG: pyridoxamine 5'-phosphate oxidase family protein [Pseudomonadota bacterium]
MTIPVTIQKLIADFPLGFVATIDKLGRPAVSPKGTFLVLDDRTIAFGNIRSPGTVENLRARSDTEVNFIDVLKRKGARLRGQARILDAASSERETHLPKWRAVWGDLAERITDIVVIDVEAVKPLATPPYDDGATEEEMIATYKSKLAGMYL